CSLEERQLPALRDDCVQRRVHGIRAREQQLGQFAGRDLLAVEHAGHVSSRLEQQVAHERHSSARIAMLTSSYQCPSWNTASRARPSSTKPTWRYAAIARALKARTVSPTRRTPSSRNP